MIEKIKSAFGGLFGLALALVVAYGWISNIVMIVKTVHDPVTGMFILRCIGVLFFPLGVVFGIFS